MAKVEGGKRGPFRFQERKKRKKLVCTNCGKEYRQRFRPNWTQSNSCSGQLCCPFCRKPTGEQ